MVNNWLIELITSSAAELGLSVLSSEIKLEHPADLALGDFSTNLALILAPRSKVPPLELAEQLKKKIIKAKEPKLRDAQVAGPGFINFFLSEKFFNVAISEILATNESFGRGELLSGQKVMIEFTDPNPFKEFHIGHLMSNTIGESISRLFEANGAEVRRACYQGDVGLHVAKTLWGMFKLETEIPSEQATLSEKVGFLGRAYALGATEYEEGSESAKEGITIINKKVYRRSDSKLNELYDLGRKWSLAYFEGIYLRLGTKFDHYFFESETAELGERLVEEGLKKNIFEKSDGATVFHGEKIDPHLHTRVFLNAEGLPTYEAKELGLAKIKADKYSADIFVSVTGNEINDYFRVVLAAMKELLPEVAVKIKHLSHGMLRLPGGKMSSRTGQVVTAESLITEVKEKVLEKIKDKELGQEEKNEIAEKVAIGAIKYSILKQGIGKDIIFDFEKSLSFEGDSGPYLQYTYTRALSVLKKAEEAGLKISLEVKISKEEKSNHLERLLYQLPEVIERSYQELAPQYLVTYLVEVASTFNSFYAGNKIIGGDQERVRLSLTKATSIVLKNGLSVLGLPILEKM